MQNEIRPLELAVMKWAVFSKLMESVELPVNVLTELIEEYRTHSGNDKLDTEEELQDFVNSLKSFVDYSLVCLSKYRYIYSSVEKESILELGKLLL